MKVRVADYIAEFLVENGINIVFSVTGGGAMHLNDAFGHNNNLKCIYNHHEQGCSMAAEGYTRAAGKAAAVCVTSGPGGTNAITGVMGAWLDSIPMFVISGQMKYVTTIASTDVPLRQLGFQEFNILDAVRCMTKYSEMIIEPQKIAYHLEKALYLMNSGRPGPVWLDIPLDIQGAMIDTDELEHFECSELENIVPDITDEQVKFVLEKIKQAKRPVILAGNGIRISHSQYKFLKVIEKLNIPVVTAWNAHDLIYDTHPLYAGRPGTIGTRGGNFVVQNSDLLISFGCRMNIRQISYEWDKFASKAYKIAIDIDDAELKKPTLHIDYPIHGNIAQFFDLILDKKYDAIASHSQWMDWCKMINKKYPVVLEEYKKKNTPINPYVFMEQLSKNLTAEDMIVASNGTACVCSFQCIEMKKGQRMFTNAGASSMGYGVAAAVGAALASDGKVICLEGDGSIQMNIQELQTIVQNKLNIKIFWLNNSGYHSIRLTQKSSFEADERGFCGVSAESGISFPSAEKIAAAYGMHYVLADNILTLEEKILKTLEGTDPVICEVLLDSEAPFAPKLSSRVNEDGTISSPSLEDMAPFLPREEMKENMISEKE